MKSIAYLTLSLMLSSFAPVHAENQALAELETLASQGNNGVPMMDGTVSAASIGYGKVYAAAEKVSSKNHHDYASDNHRDDAIRYGMEPQDGLFEAWGTSLGVWGYVPAKFMAAGYEKGLAVAGENVLGSVVGAGLALVALVAAIPTATFMSIGQFISGFFVR